MARLDARPDIVDEGLQDGVREEHALLLVEHDGGARAGDMVVQMVLNGIALVRYTVPHKKRGVGHHGPTQGTRNAWDGLKLSSGHAIEVHCPSNEVLRMACSLALIYALVV